MELPDSEAPFTIRRARLGYQAASRAPGGFPHTLTFEEASRGGKHAQMRRKQKLQTLAPFGFAVARARGAAAGKRFYRYLTRGRPPSRRRQDDEA